MFVKQVPEKETARRNGHPKLGGSLRHRIGFTV